MLGNHTQLLELSLGDTQVNGTVTSLPQLTQLELLDVSDSQVGVPTQQQIATFQQQHPGCEFYHDD